MLPGSSIEGAAQLLDFQLIGELNSGSIGKRVRERCTGICRKQFDETLVRVNWVGAMERGLDVCEYKMYCKCRTTGVNKSSTGGRKVKKTEEHRAAMRNAPKQACWGTSYRAAHMRTCASMQKNLDP